MEEDRTTPPTPSVLVKPTSQASLEQTSPLPVELDEMSAGKSMYPDGVLATVLMSCVLAPKNYRHSNRCFIKCALPPVLSEYFQCPPPILSTSGHPCL